MILSDKIKIIPGPYLFCIKCEGRRGVVVGTQLKDTLDRANVYFLFWQ